MRIGLFDSGVGGFTVLKEIFELCPNTSFIYLADTARLPYGLKTSNEIKQIAEEISSWFVHQKMMFLWLLATQQTQLPWM